MTMMIGGSAPNDRLNSRTARLTFAFALTLTTNTITGFAVVSPTVQGEAGLIYADGAGTIVPAATFDVTIAGAVPIVGLEFRDTTMTGNGQLISAQGFVYSTTGASNADLGTPVWAGPADLVLASAGVGMALNLHFGITGVGSQGKLDQNTGVVKFFVEVNYLA